MNESPNASPTPAAVTAAIKQTAYNLLLGGGACLVLSFMLPVDAPSSAEGDAEQLWYTIDHAFNWCLRGLGVLFLVASGLAAQGRPLAALLATALEGAFVLLMVLNAIERIIEGRIAGCFDVWVIILALLAIMGVNSAKSSWLLYRHAERATSPPGDDWNNV